jgi:hypothetical protein
MKLSYLSRINTTKGVDVTTTVESGLRTSGKSKGSDNAGSCDDGALEAPSKNT